jgi:hypothetical protein
MKVDELLHKLKDPFGDVGTFIQGIKYQVDGTLIREREHLFQAPRQMCTTWK